eukprot:TRINITY_DN2992_c0_g2_i2.p1 TRINITY_DN2992_c0_g2~~TRINITY_DN2992_c0_g2_i2.p1  ORF type:complete len:202 (+),score=34.32 TRINITY_DN2992_c0_g2_i2:551-1156(+)
MLDWHRKCKHCSHCGHKTISIEGGTKRKCTNKKPESSDNSQQYCGQEHYPRTDPVVIMLVISPDGKKCLLGRQKRFPPGLYTCLAGFMEPGESIEEAVRRETEEEAGVAVGKIIYWSSQPWPMSGQLMIGCYAIALSENTEVDKVELEEVIWVDVDKLKEAIKESYVQDSFLSSNKFRVPPPIAIAHKLCAAFAEGLITLI